MSEPLLLFCLDADRRLGEAVADHLGVTLAPVEDRVFEDGEHKTRPLVSVNGADVYVLTSLCDEPELGIDRKLLRLLFFVATLRDCGAARLTVVTPYLGYARKDRRTKDHDPVGSRYLAELLEAMGTQRMVALEAHNPAAFQNAFRCPNVHLESRGLMAAALAPLLAGQPVTVVSPDAGGMKRADRLREALETHLGVAPAMAIMEKRRSEGRVSGELLAGELGDRVAVIVDDLASTGTTLLRAAEACRAQGARAVWAAVTHGVFASGAAGLLQSSLFDRLLVSNSVPPRLQEHWPDSLLQVPVQGLLADTVRALHEGRPLPEVLEL